MLEIRDLKVKIEDKEILKGINLEVKPGEVHAIMGPNGSGKSTLAATLAGRDLFDVTGGKVLFEGSDLLELAPEDRAREGIFLGFQYPVEIPGVSMASSLASSLLPDLTSCVPPSMSSGNTGDLTPCLRAISLNLCGKRKRSWKSILT